MLEAERAHAEVVTAAWCAEPAHCAIRAYLDHTVHRRAAST
jgi:hypothetical protein